MILHTLEGMTDTSANQSKLRYRSSVSASVSQPFLSQSFQVIFINLDMNHISGHSRPVSRFKGVEFSIATNGGKKCFLIVRLFLMQYLKWPLGEKPFVLPV